jgi:hypothetical protein
MKGFPGVEYILENPFAVNVIKGPRTKGKGVEVSLDEVHPGIGMGEFPGPFHSFAQFHSYHLGRFPAEAVGEPADPAANVQQEFSPKKIFLHA